MPSSLTWLDYSERDRRRALDVIDLFRETGTVDELGLASIRDSFADLFFPGTSTIQTRACYFLLVPWTFQRLERFRVPSGKGAERGRTEEINLNSHLRAGDDTQGVFGALAGDALKRLPSEVYWGGLGSWGIRLFPGHVWAYFRSLDRFYRRVTQFGNLPHDAEGKKAPPTNWHPHLPEPPARFPYENVSVSLRPQDAEYLRDRIQARHPKSLLAVLAARADTSDLGYSWPWDLAHLAELSPDIRDRLHAARLFAVTMHGAALLYNLMLSELQLHEQRIETYRDRLNDWATDVESLGPGLADWRLEEVWNVVWAEGRSPSLPTQWFVRNWVHELQHQGPAAVSGDRSRARGLVLERETQVKRSRARLTNRRHLELWGGQSGTGRMDYRWSAARRILRDIFDGLKRTHGDAGNA